MPSVVWNGQVPPRCPLEDPHLGAATRPGLYVVQIVDDTTTPDSPAYAFVIFVAHGAATVENLIGPIATEADWKKFYDLLGVLGSTRPGGFFCDGVIDEKGTAVRSSGSGYAPPAPPSNCPGNPHALLSGPKTSSPPPPDTTGSVQVVDHQKLGSNPTGSLSPGQSPAMLASLHPVVGDPGQCAPLGQNSPLRQQVGIYVQRAVDAVNILSPPR
jgi:hypothetical protein